MHVDSYFLFCRKPDEHAAAEAEPQPGTSGPSAAEQREARIEAAALFAEDFGRRQHNVCNKQKL